MDSSTLKLFLLTLFLAFFLGDCFPQRSGETLEKPEIKTFEQFKQYFNKHYSSADKERKARENFRKFKQWVDENRDKLRYKVGITSQADISPEDRPLLRPLKLTKKEHDVTNTFTKVQAQSLMDSGDLPQHFDWRDRIPMSNMLDQADCGSCWAFATAVVIESSLAIHHNLTVTVSRQEILDCSQDYKPGEEHCEKGGETQYGLNYTRLNGIHSENDYPLLNKGKVDKTFPCRTDVPGQKYYVRNWGRLNHATDEEMQKFIYKYGPIAVGISTRNNCFGAYWGGVMENCESDPLDWRMNHAISVLGWGYDEVTNLDYWIVRNSWGTDWGNNSYGKIQRGINSVGLNIEPTFLH